MNVTLNIGLDGIAIDGESYTNGVRNDRTIERALAAVQCLRRHGFVPQFSQLLRSDTEPTLVIQVANPGADDHFIADAIYRVAAELQQDCIAAWDGRHGALLGPRSEAWGAFNPELFFTLDGSRLSESLTIAA